MILKPGAWTAASGSVRPRTRPPPKFPYPLRKAPITRPLNHNATPIQLVIAIRTVLLVDQKPAIVHSVDVVRRIGPRLGEMGKDSRSSDAQQNGPDSFRRIDRTHCMRSPSDMTFTTLFRVRTARQTTKKNFLWEMLGQCVAPRLKRLRQTLYWAVKNREFVPPGPMRSRTGRRHRGQRPS
jgi:hypothetical protein